MADELAKQGLNRSGGTGKRYNNLLQAKHVRFRKAFREGKHEFIDSSTKLMCVHSFHRYKCNTGRQTTARLQTQNKI